MTKRAAVAQVRRTLWGPAVSFGELSLAKQVDQAIERSERIHPGAIPQALRWQDLLDRVASYSLQRSQLVGRVARSTRQYCGNYKAGTTLPAIT